MARTDMTGSGRWRQCFLRFVLLFWAAAFSVEAKDSLSLMANKDMAFTEIFRRTNGWVAGDGTYSVALSDGRTLWLVGDSHIDDFEPATGTVPCLFQVRNAALLQEKNSTDLRVLLGKPPAGKTLFQKTNDSDSWFWPMSGFQHENVVYVYLSYLRRQGSGNFGFEKIDHAHFAKMKFPEMTVTEYVPLPSFSGIDFGCGFVTETNSGFTYAFGNKRDGIGSTVYVARFKTKIPEQAWNYWDGKGWSSKAGDAAIIAQGSSTSVQVCKIKDKFVLTSSAFSSACDQARDIFVSVSSNATGPFSPRKKIYSIDDSVQGHSPFFYLPLLQPQFINTKDEIVMLYSINGYEPCVPFCVNGRANPDHYRPKAVRVPLKLIDADF